MELFEKELCSVEKKEIAPLEMDLQAEAILCGICPGSAAVGVNAVLLCWNWVGLVAA